MPVVTEPATRKGRATKARLIQAARDVAIAHNGAIEVGRVAREAGVVPSLVNRYFGSRDGLVAAVVEDFFERLHREVLDLDLTGGGHWSRHERMRVEAGVRFHYADPFAIVLYTALGRGAQVAGIEKRQVETVIGQAARNIRRAQERGELPRDVDPELAGAAMFGAMQRVIVAALGREPRPDPGEVVDVIWRQVEAAVGITSRPRNPERKERNESV